MMSDLKSSLEVSLSLATDSHSYYARTSLASCTFDLCIAVAAARADSCPWARWIRCRI